MQGRGSATVRDFALYGETDRRDGRVRPARALQLGAGVPRPARGRYGHTPVPEPEWLNRTINIDTGCVFGGG
jgi:protein phosphatase